MDTRRHHIQIYTPVSFIDGTLELPVQTSRLSDYLRLRQQPVLVVHDATVIYADGDRKEGTQVGVAADAALALIDCEPPSVSEPYMRSPTRPVRIEVSYAAGLRIEGDLHLRVAVEYDNVLAGLSTGDTMRVLTNCVVRLGGTVVSQGKTIITDLATAAHALELPGEDTSLPESDLEVAEAPVLLRAET